MPLTPDERLELLRRAKALEDEADDLRREHGWDTKESDRLRNRAAGLREAVARVPRTPGPGLPIDLEDVRGEVPADEDAEDCGRLI